MRKAAAFALVLCLCVSGLVPAAAQAAQTEPWVLQTSYRDDGTYKGTIRYAYNDGGLLTEEVWETWGQTIYYDYSFDGILKNIYTYRNGEAETMQKFPGGRDSWILWVADRDGNYQITQDFTCTYDGADRMESSLLQRYSDTETWCESNVYTYHETGEPAVGDTVTFGRYEQDGDIQNGMEDIRWLVLDRKGENLLLLSVQALDTEKYHTANVAVSWKDCALRRELNGSFFDVAFAYANREAIVKTQVEPGAGTDRVFLLSLEELNRYFSTNTDRLCKPTDYAVSRNAYVNATTGGSWWLLRTSASDGSKVLSVNSDGSIDLDGGSVASDRGTVRPAIWIRADAVTGQQAAVHTVEYSDYYMMNDVRVEHCHKVSTYDPEGRLLSVTQDLNDGTQVEFKTVYTYDANGNVQEISSVVTDNYSYRYTTHTTCRNLYNFQKQLVRVEQTVSRTDESLLRPENNTSSVTSWVTAYRYDTAGNKTREERTDAEGGQPYVYTWEYDAYGNLLKATEDGKVVEQNTYGPISQVRK